MVHLFKINFLAIQRKYTMDLYLGLHRRDEVFVDIAMFFKIFNVTLQKKSEQRTTLTVAAT